VLEALGIFILALSAGYLATVIFMFPVSVIMKAVKLKAYVTVTNNVVLLIFVTVIFVLIKMIRAEITG
jgi:hypothetical protein